jgi:glycosyltransferase involved in cell wall biosynthesis
MNILMVSDYNPQSIGGVQSSVKSQVDELRNQGHRVVLLSPSNEQQYGLSDDDIFYVPSFRWFRINNHAVASPLRFSVGQLAKDLAVISSFDVIHSQTTSVLGVCARRIADILSLPLVQTMHGRDDVFVARGMRFPIISATVMHLLDIIFVQPRHSFPLKNVSLVSRLMWDIMLNRADRADAVTIPSHHFADKFITKGLDPKKVHVISNGIPDARVDTIDLSQPHDSSSTPSFVWAGRVSAEKQPDLAIRAITQVENCTLDIYGGGQMKDDCQRLIRQLDLEDRVHMHGDYKESEIYKIMAKHSALLYTSYDFDNQPVVMLEAAVVGLPVLFCDPDLAECLPDEGAILSEAPTVSSFSKTINSVVTNQGALLSMRNTLINARNNYRQSVHTAKMVELYRSIQEQTAV